ncbi:response regulator [Phormidium sp. FACHB-592]|uniref:Response regulator n=2 Tax=Cyanophyceae TaxID=3028117 RepID=A0ABV0KIS1_9CYAN|nr:response regulator [Phormidium sp. FACHB-592]
MPHLPLLRKGLRVLVVDGTADCRDLLTMLFDSYKVETTTATCVSEAIERMQQTLPDFVISELFLPSEDGHALMDKVKAFETTYRVQIPAIALTVCVGVHERTRALTAGFCRHLAKPLDIDKLLAMIVCRTGSVQAMAANTCL